MDKSKDLTIEEAKESRDSGIAIYSQFMLDYDPKSGNTIYCFYEGREDPNYYSSRISIRHNDLALNEYICNGKSEVLKTHSHIKSKDIYWNGIGKLAFFVDKDFDNNSVLEKVYITPVYSIENLYCPEECLSKVLIREFNCAKIEPDHKLILDIYSKLKNEFLTQITPLNVFISCQRDIEKNSPNGNKLNIDESLKKHFSNRKVVKVDLSGIVLPSSIKTIESLYTVFRDSTKVAKNELEKKQDSFDNCNKEEVFRGKFLIRFLVDFLQRLQVEIGKKKNRAFQKRFVCQHKFDYSTITSIISDSAHTPDSLIKFIDTVCNPNGNLN